MLVAVVACALAGAPAAAPVYAGVLARNLSLKDAAEHAAIALGQALEKKGAVDVGSPPLPDTAGGPDAILKSLVAAAADKYSEGDFSLAVSRADEAVARFEGGGAYRAGPAWKSFSDALVVKALALRRLGKEGDADATLGLLAATMPGAVPDPAITPPKVAERYKQIVDDMRAKPRVSIEVSSTPSGADVVVDGRAQGKAPVVVRDLLAGVHFVGLAAEGEHAQKMVTLPPGENGRVAEKVGDPRAIAARGLRAALASPVAREVVISEAKKVADDVVVGALVKDAGGPLLVVARVRGGEITVAGARVEKASQVKPRADALAAAVLHDPPGTSWLGEGPATPSAIFLSGVPALAAGDGHGDGRGDGADGGGDGNGDHRPADGEGELDTGTIVLASVGAGVAVAVITGAVLGYLVADASSKKVTVTIDGSKLKHPS